MRPNLQLSIFQLSSLFYSLALFQKHLRFNKNQRTLRIETLKRMNFTHNMTKINAKDNMGRRQIEGKKKM